MLNSLSQTLLKLASPGVPDIYQGSELWDFSLVDPDNRRPVDYARRTRLLDELQQSLRGSDVARYAFELLSSMQDGRIKLYLIWQALALRRALPELFAQGDYVPLGVHGDKAEHVCAFARHGERMAIVIAPRLIGRLVSDEATAPIGPLVWGDTRIELPREWANVAFTNAFTAECVLLHDDGAQASLPLHQALASFPVALLAGAPKTR